MNLHAPPASTARLASARALVNCLRDEFCRLGAMMETSGSSESHSRDSVQSSRRASVRLSTGLWVSEDAVGLKRVVKMARRSPCDVTTPAPHCGEISEPGTTSASIIKFDSNKSKNDSQGVPTAAVRPSTVLSNSANPAKKSRLSPSSGYWLGRSLEAIE
jgi:hypothetical protein